MMSPEDMASMASLFSLEGGGGGGGDQAALAANMAKLLAMYQGVAAAAAGGTGAGEQATASAGASSSSGSMLDLLGGAQQDMGGGKGYGKDSKGKTLCKYFIMNGCTNGKNCPFSHGEPSDSEMFRFTGIITCFLPEKGYAFLRCPELLQVYGKDVWVHSGKMEHVSVGDTVSFSVIERKGNPQAVDLEKSDTKMTGNEALPGEPVLVCSRHAIERGCTTMESDGMGGMACKRGMECVKSWSPSTMVCKFFQMGTCVKGDQCQFAHPDGAEGTSPGIMPVTKVDAPCPFWANKGGCKYGNNCWYNHEPKGISPLGGESAASGLGDLLSAFAKEAGALDELSGEPPGLDKGKGNGKAGKSKEPCEFFAKGLCKYTNCWFSHDLDTSSSTTDPWSSSTTDPWSGEIPDLSDGLGILAGLLGKGIGKGKGKGDSFAKGGSFEKGGKEKAGLGKGKGKVASSFGAQKGEGNEFLNFIEKVQETDSPVADMASEYSNKRKRVQELMDEIKRRKQLA